MEDLSLHVLDIAENGVRAGAKRIEIRIVADPARGLLTIEISDDGQGMDQEELRRAQDPFYTTKTVRRVGLGLPMFAQAAREAGGDLVLESARGKGTIVKARFLIAHVDRRPLGNLAQTLVTLMAGAPEVDFALTFGAGGIETAVDTADLRGDGPRAHWDAGVLKAVRDRVADGIRAVGEGSGFKD